MQNTKSKQSKLGFLTYSPKLSFEKSLLFLFPIWNDCTTKACDLKNYLFQQKIYILNNNNSILIMVSYKKPRFGQNEQTDTNFWLNCHLYKYFKYLKYSANLSSGKLPELQGTKWDSIIYLYKYLLIRNETKKSEQQNTENKIGISSAKVSWSNISFLQYDTKRKNSRWGLHNNSKISS